MVRKFIPSDIFHTKSATQENSLSVYPNPSSGEISVNLSGWQDQEIEFSIRNMMGMEMTRLKINQTGTLEKILLPDSLPNGLYWLSEST